MCGKLRANPFFYNGKSFFVRYFVPVILEKRKICGRGREDVVPVWEREIKRLLKTEWKTFR